jgi:hypothetical protein
LIYCCRNGDLAILFCEQLCKDSSHTSEDVSHKMDKKNGLKTKKNKNENNNKNNNHNRAVLDDGNNLALKLSKTYQYKSKLIDSILSKETIAKLKVCYML